jgi:cysteine desulfurase/selenocysteine lyase
MDRKVLDVEAVRRDFPILQHPLPNGLPVIYLDTAASAQKPHVVIDREADCYARYYANAHRGNYHFGVLIDEAVEGTRRKVQTFIGAAEPEEVIFTSGTTMSINLVASAWGRRHLKPGDEIVLNEMEHHANIVPWQKVAGETGAVLKYIPLTDDGRLKLAALDDTLSERTRIVAVTAMSNVLGTINPIGEIARKTHERGALVLVDAAQSVPHLPTNVRDPQIDFLAFSGHKLYGPNGIGVLYGRRELLEEMDPFLCGGHMIDQVFRDHSTWAPIPAKFEAGTLPIAPAIALGAAVDYVNSLGLEAIEVHEHSLLVRAHEKLAAIPGLRIFGPDPSGKGAIVSFAIEGIHPQDLSMLLDLKGIAVRYGHHCTMPLHDRLGVSATTRASFGIYNTLSEVDALVDGIEYARKKLLRR